MEGAESIDVGGPAKQSFPEDQRHQCENMGQVKAKGFLQQEEGVAELEQGKQWDECGLQGEQFDRGATEEDAELEN